MCPQGSRSLPNPLLADTREVTTFPEGTLRLSQPSILQAGWQALNFSDAGQTAIFFFYLILTYLLSSDPTLNAFTESGSSIVLLRASK